MIRAQQSSSQINFFIQQYLANERVGIFVFHQVQKVNAHLSQAFTDIHLRYGGGCYQLRNTKLDIKYAIFIFMQMYFVLLSVIHYFALPYWLAVNYFFSLSLIRSKELNRFCILSYLTYYEVRSVFVKFNMSISVSNAIGRWII